MSKKHKKVSTTLNYTEYFLILSFAITRCVSISLVGIPIGITSTATELKSFSIFAGIKKSIINNQSIIKEKKKHDKIVLLTKPKLSHIEVLISKAVMDSVICQDEFVLTTNALK